MHLVQLLIPLNDNQGHAFPSGHYRALRSELSDKFGGITAYSRAPAEGSWNDGSRHVCDEIVVYEVMVERLDAAWWADYRKLLEHRFKQDQIIIRAIESHIL